MTTEYRPEKDTEYQAETAWDDFAMALAEARYADAQEPAEELLGWLEDGVAIPPDMAAQNEGKTRAQLCDWLRGYAAGWFNER